MRMSTITVRELVQREINKISNRVSEISQGIFDAAASIDALKRERDILMEQYRIYCAALDAGAFEDQSGK